MGLKALPWLPPRPPRGPRRRYAWVPLTLLVAGLVLLGAVAAPARAANHAINLHAPAQVPVGQAAAVDIDGVVAPPAEFWDESWIELVALPGSLGSCPGDAGSAGLMAEQTGLILGIALRPNADEAGNFTGRIAFAPTAAGVVLICAYLYNEVGYTWAAAGVRIEIVDSPAPAPPSGGGGGPPASSQRPVNLTLPWVTRSGNRLVCHPGSWSNASGSFAYNWLLDGNLTEATGRRSPVPSRARRGHRFSCQVTAYGPGGGSATATSRPLRLGCGCALRRPG
jgi:hypothetical protein